MTCRRLVLTIACVASLGPVAASASASDCAGSDLVPTAANAQQVGEATLCLLNEQRAAAGLTPLSLDPALGQMASGYAGELVAGAFFSHVSPSGETLQDRLAAVDYRFTVAGENLAWGTSGVASAGQIVGSWMQSEGHRANILEPDYRQIGIGVAAGTPTGSGAPGATYVTEFGTPPAQQAVRRQPRRVRVAKSRRARAMGRTASVARRVHQRRARARARARAHRRADARRRADVRRRARAQRLG